MFYKSEKEEKFIMDESKEAITNKFILCADKCCNLVKCLKKDFKNEIWLIMRPCFIESSLVKDLSKSLKKSKMKDIDSTLFNPQ